MESSDAALAALRRYITRPANLFDRYEAIELLQSLLRLARNEGLEKANEYAAALDEIRARFDQLENVQLQRLFLGLLGDPVRAKVAKDANTILKNAGAGKSFYSPDRGAARPDPYQRNRIRCFRCLRWGHYARSCRSRRQPFYGRGRAAHY